MTRTTRLLLAVLAACGLVTAGCSGSGDDVPDQTITVQEAADRLEARIREVAAAIPARDLESLNPGRGPDGRPLAEPLIGPCGGVLGGPEDGRVSASRSYALLDVPTEQVDSAIRTTIDYMTANGYDVSIRNLEQGIVWANAPDGTTGLVIRRSVDGYVTIGANSICVWPDGTRPAQ